MLCGVLRYQTQVNAGYGDRVECIAALNKNRWAQRRGGGGGGAVRRSEAEDCVMMKQGQTDGGNALERRRKR